MHPIDRLAEVRRQIRTLKREAREIVAKLDAGAVGPDGQRYRALTYQTTITVPIDRPAPVVEPFQNSQQAQAGLGGADSRFGAGKFGHQSYGVGTPAFGQVP